jgi:Carboxypeptidase regulatory-like domain
MTSRTSLALVLLLTACCRLLAPSAAAADATQTGIIAGEVVDPTQVRLQGVQVEISGPQIRRSALTDAQGRFRFPALGLGLYQVTAELLGLWAQATDVAVHIGRTTELLLQLGPGGGTAAAPGAEAGPGAGEKAATGAGATRPGAAGGEAPGEHDVIQVIAEAPVVDRFDTRIGAIVSFDFLDQLPVERFYQSAAMMLPDVVEGEDGNPNASGALRNQNLFLIDGVDTTDPTTGLFGLNLAYEAVQEVSVITAGAPAEYGRASGAMINVVTRSGTQEFHGSARLFASNNTWDNRYDYKPQEVQSIAPDIQAFNSSPDRIDPQAELSLGGPLWRDHLWFFGGYETSKNTILAPTQQGTTWNQGLDLRAGAFKLTSQLAQSHTVVLQETLDSANFADFTPFDRGFAENRVGRKPSHLRSPLIVDRIPGDIFALQQEGQSGDFSKLQYNGALTQSFSVELTLADQRRKLTRGRLNSRGVTADAPHEAVQVNDVSLFNGIPDNGFERRPRRQGNLAATWFAALGPTDHQVKAGIDYQRNDSVRLFNFGGQPGIDPATGNAVDGQLYVDQDQRPECQTMVCPAFDPGSGSFSPAQLFNFWHRVPNQTREETSAGYLADSIVAGRFVVSLGVRYESLHADDRHGTVLVDSRSFAPRLGVTYDPLGDGKSLLTASAGRYYEPFLQQYADSFTQPDVFSGYSLYQWAQGPGCDPVVHQADPSSPCWSFVGPADFFLTQLAPPNRRLKPSYVDELALGFKRQLTASTALSLHFLERTWHQLWNNVVHLDGFDASGNPILSSRILNLPEARRRHQAVQVMLQKRYSAHWQMLASYTYSRTEGNLFQNDGADTFGDFRDISNTDLVNRFGPAPYDRTHVLKVFSSVQVPLGRHNLSLGAALLYESGLPFQTEALDPTLPSNLGVRFLTPRGSDRLPDVFQLDLLLGYRVRVGGGLELDARGEVFNVTNGRRVLAVETLLDTGNFGQPRSLGDLQAPRNYRLTLGLRF